MSRFDIKTLIFPSFFTSLLLYFVFQLSACSQNNDPIYHSHILTAPPNYIINDDLSIARKWNEVLLNSIRLDYARPTVHARNLFHISGAMFDSWALFDKDATPYLINSNNKIDSCEISIFRLEESKRVLDEIQSQQKSISYAAYFLIIHRFKHSPKFEYTRGLADTLMQHSGFDLNVDFSNDIAAKIGRDIAACYIQYGFQDGANEENQYINQFYQSINPPLQLNLAGNPGILNLDRWQPLAFSEAFIDQSGNQINTGDTPKFLGAEWGKVKPFSLLETDLKIHNTSIGDYWVYNDPGAPPLSSGDRLAEYQWGFSLVAAWSSHLSHDNNTVIDISPASIGNTDQLPNNFDDMKAFYNFELGGDNSTGYALNPITSEPYISQWVPLGDYSRVLAEFWADGPDSETPPGHWFVIFNKVSDHPLLSKKIQGEGEYLSNLEWDIKGYFTLGGAMHDAAISAWGAKGYYDYIRPISAIRAMAERGQSSDNSRDNYHAKGIPLIEGFIETVSFTDDLAGELSRHQGKIKIKAWMGHDKLEDTQTDTAGVGWILAENWWPYQRPSFVTPPFAGYVSGHSTFSRAAAEVLGLYTGSPYFPGGIGEFKVRANDFLVFENGPSVGLTLQWASYIDASDQCSLSRIWGGIHPPADDIPGRIMGVSIGTQATQKAFSYF